MRQGFYFLSRFAFVHCGFSTLALLIFIVTRLLGFIFFDFPFGLGRESWDAHPLSAEELKTIIRKIQSMSAFPWFRFVAVVRQNLCAVYQEAMKDVGIGIST